MQKETNAITLIGISLTIFFCALFLALPQNAMAKSKPSPIEGVSYNVNASMLNNIKPLIGKKVYIHLDSGATFSGFVKEIGKHLIHLEKLDRKDFFDALIRIEKIIAIDTQFRKY
ncbi:MAG: hypothetical protein KAJ62_08685 [Desulfobacteraceae bacterium]|nr:hypothetical protein [Desulfobacteraceae bacterium]